MPVDKIIIGKKYKFDNKHFFKEVPGCYGIDFADLTFLFNSNTLEFEFFSYIDEYNQDIIRQEPSEKIIFYCKGMTESNSLASDTFGRKVWRGRSNLLYYLEETNVFVQEEFDI